MAQIMEVINGNPAARSAGSQTRCRKFRRKGPPSGLVNTRGTIVRLNKAAPLRGAAGRH